MGARGKPGSSVRKKPLGRVGRSPLISLTFIMPVDPSVEDAESETEEQRARLYLQEDFNQAAVDGFFHYHGRVIHSGGRQCQHCG